MSSTNPKYELLLALLLLPSIIFSQATEEFNLSVCMGSCLEIGEDEDAGYCFLWEERRPGEGLVVIPSQASKIEVCPTENTTYRRTTVSEEGDIETYQNYHINVVNGQLSISANTMALCPDSSVKLKASEGFQTYLWSNGMLGRSINVTEPGTYDVTATIDGCSFQSSYDVSDFPTLADLENQGFYKLPVNFLSISSLTGDQGTAGQAKSFMSIILNIDNHPLEEIELIEVVERFTEYVSPEFSLPVTYTLITSGERICTEETMQNNENFNNAQNAIWFHVVDSPDDDDYVFFKAKSSKFAQEITSPISQEHVDYIDLVVELALNEVDHPSLNKSEHTVFLVLESLVNGFDVSHNSLMSPDICEEVSMPFKTLAPAGVTTIQQFIDLIKVEEDRIESSNPGDSRKTKDMITKLRRIFYNTNGWNNFIVPGTSAPELQSPYGEPYDIVHSYIDVKSRYAGEGTATSYRFPEPETYPSLDGTLQGQPEIYKVRGDVVLTEGAHAGLLIDMAHVLAGLDAYNHLSEVCPTDVLIQELIDETYVACLPNTQAALFAGDLGSSVVYAFLPTRKVHPLVSVRDHYDYVSWVQGAIDRGSPPQDLLGNIDPIVIKQFYDINIEANGPKVSEILEHFYLNKNNLIFPFNFASSQDARFHVYASELGLSYDVSLEQFTNKDDIIESITPHIRAASLLFHSIRLKGDGYVSLGVGSPNAIRIYHQRLNKELLRCFVNSLEMIIRDE